MPLAGFELPADKYGRDPGLLEPSGGTLTIDISAAANGGLLPGDLNEIERKMQIVRITSNKHCYIAFSSGTVSADATSNDMLFLAGTEAMKLPLGTSFVSGIVVDPADTGKLSVTVMT